MKSNLSKSSKIATLKKALLNPIEMSFKKKIANITLKQPIIKSIKSEHTTPSIGSKRAKQIFKEALNYKSGIPIPCMN